MGLLDRAKVAAGQAATRAKEGAGQVQTKREMGHAYGELGRSTFEHVEKGELEHPRLSPTVERIRTLKAQLEPEQVGGSPPSASGEPPASPRY
jgi:hypothetical protein